MRCAFPSPCLPAIPFMCSPKFWRNATANLDPRMGSSFLSIAALTTEMNSFVPASAARSCCASPGHPADDYRGRLRMSSPTNQPNEDRISLRSLLFVPGDSERKLAKAEDTAADALILDLDDSRAH